MKINGFSPEGEEREREKEKGKIDNKTFFI